MMPPNLTVAKVRQLGVSLTKAERIHLAFVYARLYVELKGHRPPGGTALPSARAYLCSEAGIETCFVQLGNVLYQQRVIKKVLLVPNVRTTSRRRVNVQDHSIAQAL